MYPEFLDPEKRPWVGYSEFLMGSDGARCVEEKFTMSKNYNVFIINAWREKPGFYVTQS